LFVIIREKRDNNSVDFHICSFAERNNGFFLSKEMEMAQFTVNTNRFDPYKNFKFRIKWDGRYVAGIDKVSPLVRQTEVIQWREGGDPSSSRKSPGRSEYAAIVMERGVTHDMEFEKWANKVWNYGSGLGMEMSLSDFRKDIILELYNEAGQVVIAYMIYRCWISRFEALPELDANTPRVAIQKIIVENEGWERDYEIHEPKEPGFTEPSD
jgi:phage tail-like protein